MKTIEYELKTLRYKQQILAILIFSLVTIAIWVLASLASSQRESKIEPALQAISKPLNPSINEEVLDQIERKRRYTDSELSQFPIYRLLTEDERDAQGRVPSAIGPNLAAQLGLPATPSATPSQLDLLVNPTPVVTSPSPVPSTSPSNL